MPAREKDNERSHSTISEDICSRMVKTISLQWVSVKLVSHTVFPTPRIDMFSNSQMFWYSGYKVDLEKLPGKWKIG